MKVLCAYIGDRKACSDKLEGRVRFALRNLDAVARMRDTRQHNVSMQVQSEILPGRRI